MKKIFVICSLLCSVALTSLAQDRYFTRTGHISFYSEAALENIEAHNHQTTCILDITKGELAFSVNMKGFEFEKALMQEHFNENYVESDKYPKSTFKGKIVNFENIDLDRNGNHKVEVEGDLFIHGVTKQIKAEGSLEVNGGKIIASSNFPVTVKDYKIKIPKTVIDNIAKIVDVTVKLELEPYNR
ncbi:YceI family protein [Fulvivirgaceae bacterium BMA10]|uniref:YceI family protein n=1 Tax=Splendidivirga corallicola TaxID=3051826 RepID=A0ABT8KKY9_9BACT|nr:YceI family protein [Fulvivirgaceae bacterium BMA10]